MSGTLQSAPSTGGFLTPFTASSPFSALSGVIDPRTGLPINNQAAYGPTGIPIASTQAAVAQQQAQANGQSIPVAGNAPNSPPPAAPVSQTTQSLPSTLPYMGPQDDFGTPVDTNPTPAAPPGPPMPAGTSVADADNAIPPSSASSILNRYDDLDRQLNATTRTPQPQSQTDAPTPDQTGPTGFGVRPSADADPQAYEGKGLSKPHLDSLWQVITGGESGGSRDPTHAKNPQSSAYGAAQFIDSTRDAFLATPAARAAGYTVDSFKNDPSVQRAAFDWLTTNNYNTLSAAAGGQTVPDGALEAAHAIGTRGVMALVQRPGEKAVAAYNSGTGKDNGQSALIDKNKAWGITANDTADTALKKIAAYYDRGRKSPGTVSQTTSAPGQAAPAPVLTTSDAGPATPTTPQPPKLDPTTGLPVTQGAQNAQPGSQTPLPGELPGYSPVQPADKYLALASGILQGGPGQGGLANGLGKGLAAMQRLGMDDQTQRFKFAQEAANTALSRERLGLVGAQTTNAQLKPGQVDAALQAKIDANKAAHDVAMQRVGVMQGRLNNANDNLQATLDGSKSYGGAIGKDSAQTAQRMFGDTTAATNDLQQIDDLKKVIGDNPNAVGGTYAAQAGRFLADKFGIDVGVNPDANSVAQKLIANFNNQAALGQGKGVGGRITQQEFAQFRQAAANLGTRPEAWKAMLDTYEDAAKRRLAIANEFSGLRQNPQAFHQALVAPGGLGGWYQSRVDGQNAARGITPQTGAQPQYATPPGGGIIHSGGGSNGVPAYTVSPM